jgi:hypothetical protein
MFQREFKWKDRKCNIFFRLNSRSIRIEYLVPYTGEKKQKYLKIWIFIYSRYIGAVNSKCMWHSNSVILSLTDRHTWETNTFVLCERMMQHVWKSRWWVMKILLRIFRIWTNYSYTLSYIRNTLLDNFTGSKNYYTVPLL